jgi:archaellin
MITTAFLVNTLFGIAFLFAAAVALYVVFRIGMSVLRKAKDAGVTIGDGIQSSEIAIMQKLLKEELSEVAEIEALRKMKKAVEKAIAQGKQL